MEKLRLGGMALQNGVLVHGPTSWAAAIRDDRGDIRVASGPKRRFAPGVQVPFLRGPLRLAEAMAVLPEVRRALPGVRFAHERPSIMVTVVASSLLGAVARRSRLGVLPREAIVAIASITPALLALRGGELASYHGAEHVSIGRYESDGPVTKEHERCGSHLVGPMIVTSATASALAQRVPARHRRAAQVAGSVGAVGAAVEIFSWAARHPDTRLGRLLARPGHELQSRIATADPSRAQLAVAEAALAACLEAEAPTAA